MSVLIHSCSCFLSRKGQTSAVMLTMLCNMQLFYFEVSFNVLNDLMSKSLVTAPILKHCQLHSVAQLSTLFDNSATLQVRSWQRHDQHHHHHHHHRQPAASSTISPQVQRPSSTTDLSLIIKPANSSCETLQPKDKHFQCYKHTHTHTHTRTHTHRRTSAVGCEVGHLLKSVQEGCYSDKRRPERHNGGKFKLHFLIILHL